MATPALTFGGSISQNYEDYLGQFLFEPFAVDLAGRIDFTGVSKVLELACGSGRVTKHLAEILPANAEFTASDISIDIINIAKSRVTSDRVKWTEANMLDLPFEDGSFDLVICQFAVMLVPDQLKAMAEIFRILQPGGKVIFSTWSDINYNKVWAAGDGVLNTYLGQRVLQRDPGPFTLGDKSLVQNMLSGIGFSKIHATLVDCTGETESAAKGAYGFIHGLPLSLIIQKENPQLLPEIVKALEERLRDELGDRPLKVPQRALVFEAVK